VEGGRLGCPQLIVSDDYHNELRWAIQQTHGGAPLWVESVPVKEVFRGATVFDGTVEVFSLSEHPKAKRCFAWGFKNDAGKWQTTAVLEIPPVTSPETAVKVAIAAHARQGKPPQ
jgi:hypothetical protein